MIQIRIVGDQPADVDTAAAIVAAVLDVEHTSRAVPRRSGRGVSRYLRAFLPRTLRRTVPGMSRAAAEKRRRGAQVLMLVDQAYDAGPGSDQDRIMVEALELDAGAVAVIVGAINAGVMPDPDKNPTEWKTFVASVRDQLGRP